MVEGQEESLVCAYALDGGGGGRKLDWNGVDAWTPADGPVWIHLDRSAQRSQEWLRQRANLEPVIVDSLLEEETRPRTVAFGDGLLMILRGVNLNPGADPEDMIAMRIWMDDQRIITLRARRLMAVQDVRDRLENGRGGRNLGDVLIELAGKLMDRMGPVIEALDDTVDDLEDQFITGEKREIRQALALTRRQAISLRRYLAPQREALSRLQSEEVAWLEASHKIRLREVNDRLMRYVEDLDAVRERAAVIQDELMNRNSEQMNKTMYVLTVVAAVMLPLGFITGLLGINVGGIPGTESGVAFWVVCAFLAVLALVQVVMFRRLRWI